MLKQGAATLDIDILSLIAGLVLWVPILTMFTTNVILIVFIIRYVKEHIHNFNTLSSLKKAGIIALIICMVAIAALTIMLVVAAVEIAITF